MCDTHRLNEKQIRETLFSIIPTLKRFVKISNHATILILFCFRKYRGGVGDVA
jgi:hypothetical protein